VYSKGRVVLAGGLWGNGGEHTMTRYYGAPSELKLRRGRGE
jgi:hypothetical protein